MIISTKGLVKRYGATLALDEVDLAVPDGAVYGLVGRNGAGKTTMLGILAGLRRPTAGTVHLAVERTRVAVLPDTPRFEPWLTAREVVDLSRALAAPGVAAARVDAVLEEAGLAHVSAKRVGGFSRGMLQRLGLAATVVGRPDVLLLDEPSSALDPAGRREVLDLVGRLRGNATVLFSSHILGDVQEVCDTVGILREGRLLFQGPLDALLTGRAVPGFLIRLRSPLEPAVAALEAEPWVNGTQVVTADQLLVSITSVEEAETRLPATLAAAGARVVSFGPAEASLEDVFLELTG